MTMFQFEVLCGEYLLDPSLVLEHAKIVAALKEGESEAEIRTLLETEF